ncbi:MAG: type II CRISPR RNA-guided endonuclease Cas9 [Flavobacteriaceae bacterium]|nr:MAG: type II CRISPR RNA-guided endonuclease Cas9 [Flavobacteriaceae bacterium]
MKTILGLDLGTTSIGWALVKEAENDTETSEIIKLGVRVNPLSVDELTDFEKGRPLSTNADRTLTRGARRNLQRFKLRRSNLIQILKENHFINEQSVLTEIGKHTTHETLSFRAKGAKEKISLEAFAKVLLSINKKRGYKSSRKAKNEEEGSLIDGMSIAKELYDNNMTPGQFVYHLLKNDKKFIPDFYRSDLESEFLLIWNHQKNYYPELLEDSLFEQLKDKNKTQTWAICKAPFELVGILQKGKVQEKKVERYKWRDEALTKQVDLETLAIVLQEVNNNINGSSGYLGAISDRSKELYFNKETVGENLYYQLVVNKHTSLKNQVFYRQDYLDEFEQLWETQAKHHPVLTTKLKEEIRDVVIFYQRKLKSQKHLISNCQFEKHHKAIPKSSPLFQEFKIWQVLNNLEFTHKKTKEKTTLAEELRQDLFDEVNIKGGLNLTGLYKFIGINAKEYSCNYKEGIEGNRTNEALYEVYHKIAEEEGYGFEWSKKTGAAIKTELTAIFKTAGIDASILDFDPTLNGTEYEAQASFKLWHLLYSAEDDEKISKEDQLIYGNSNVRLKKNLCKKFGFKPAYAALLSGVTLQPDYGSLSSRAIKKIIPFLVDGHDFYEAAALAKYNHSNAKTAEEQAERFLKDKLDLLKKNSLRNPVVEKIINQMVNVINLIIDTYGKPDEIRIELARELKKSAKQRGEMTTSINKATTKNIELKKIITKDFGIPNPTKNDLIRYKLWLELEANGFKTVFTNKYIPKEELFSKNIDIEHIIPKAILFDDSFSNKTLAYRSVNLKKADRTAMDFISDDYNADKDDYIKRVESLYNNGKGAFSKGKYKKLLMPKSDLPDGFIERDLRNSQYIAKKAKMMLEEVVRTVVSSSGTITSKLREDWDLINVMKELNFPKYKALGLTEIQIRKDNKKVEVIKDWTKRNDHRHHAMDALSVAFTTHNHIQYLNNLNAARTKESRLFQIKNKITSNNQHGKRVFIAPMPNFRQEAKKHLESVLISFKAKNKVVTKNKNKIKGQDTPKIQLTPRGQLHKETVYAKQLVIINKEEKVSGKFDLKKIAQVTKPLYKDALFMRLAAHNNDPKKAFTGKNSLEKTPLYLNDAQTKYVPEKVKLQFTEELFTIRKPITHELKIEKVTDAGIRKKLSQRLKEYNNNKKEAFSNLDKNPIWLDKKNNIAIKRVTITGVSNTEALHTKKDHLGNPILKNGKEIPVDFVSTGNNHHVAIYKDSKGKLQEKAVSFYEAVARVNTELPIIDYDYNEQIGWTFMFTMKQNEMFVFPSNGFNPSENDLLDEKNTALISEHLFRVQKIASKDYSFRHHLETTVENNNVLKSLNWKREGLNGLTGIIKVRTNHIGKIVAIGEEIQQEKRVLN